MNDQRTALVTFLQNTSHLTNEMASQIAEQFQYREIEKSVLFLKQGRQSNEYLFLQSGYMRAWLSDVDGNEITTNLYSPGGVVFEVASFFQRIPAQENLEATTDCTGWALTFEQLNYLFHSTPEFREFGRAVLVKGFISFKMRTLSLINKTAEQRYAQLLETRSELFQHIPLKYIASYLGITDTSLSRIRKNQKEKGY